MIIRIEILELSLGQYTHSHSLSCINSEYSLNILYCWCAVCSCFCCSKPTSTTACCARALRSFTDSIRWKTLDGWRKKKRLAADIRFVVRMCLFACVCSCLCFPLGRLRGALCVQRCYVLVKCSIRVLFMLFRHSMPLLFGLAAAVAAAVNVPCICALHTLYYFAVYSTCKFESAEWFAGCGMWLRKRFMLCAR